MATDTLAPVVRAPQDTNGALLESLIIGGDLAKLTPAQRVEYYAKVCASLALNPLTQPFQYLFLSNKLVLYAAKNCGEQLRALRGISIPRLEKEQDDDTYTVTAYAKDATGREDVATGVVPIAGLRGEAKANAKMKAETKAKRRVTLSICGLGMLDDSEVDGVRGARRASVNPETGEIEEPARDPVPEDDDEQLLTSETQRPKIAPPEDVADLVARIKARWAQLNVSETLQRRQWAAHCGQVPFGEAAPTLDVSMLNILLGLLGAKR